MAQKEIEDVILDGACNQADMLRFANRRISVNGIYTPYQNHNLCRHSFEKTRMIRASFYGCNLKYVSLFGAQITVTVWPGTFDSENRYTNGFIVLYLGHASGEIYVISLALAHFISINRSILRTFMPMMMSVLDHSILGSMGSMLTREV
ncbi:hypothetical protein HHK36_027581 [Tetracentron sinense]|uniref:Uncharacterized protein n=1 Tax=Tetracentron sinense TaxID=13715 RepID=A0A835D1P8_TETSI|nr:hypothetical protein HHK36_027581 [Tetracentron sinense]